MLLKIRTKEPYAVYPSSASNMQEAFYVEAMEVPATSPNEIFFYRGMNGMEYEIPVEELLSVSIIDPPIGGTERRLFTAKEEGEEK